ncbi:unnamed protein product [Cuscuta campestris]|uniref:Uncharacterized protein n=1 Tax=Cuscuta campestris TaxID=132261 RepID=A0A484MN00_9ASTE|nr:unnamed protein product [Cuscuta campestris]
MVLWEITLASAYFLGLKRTYRLALKIQRRVISPEYPKIRQFAYRRTRGVFDVALKVHRKIQERDLEAGRNLGNWILRWLDKAKPTANIRGQHPPPCIGGGSQNTKITDKKPDGFRKYDPLNHQDKGPSRHLSTSLSSSSSSSRNLLLPKTFPSVAMMMRPGVAATTTATSIHHQFRQLSIYRQPADSTKASLGSFSCNGSIIRNDIMQWIRRGP